MTKESEHKPTEAKVFEDLEVFTLRLLGKLVIVSCAFTYARERMIFFALFI